MSFFVIFVRMRPGTELESKNLLLSSTHTTARLYLSQHPDTWHAGHLAPAFVGVTMRWPVPTYNKGIVQTHIGLKGNATLIAEGCNIGQFARINISFFTTGLAPVLQIYNLYGVEISMTKSPDNHRYKLQVKSLSKSK